MDYSEALQRLKNHASAPEGASFTLALYQAHRHATVPQLSSSFEDILSCFEAVNQALNGRHPSKTVRGKMETLPRSLVANVSSILSEGCSYHLRWVSSEKFTDTVRAELASMLVQIALAWDAILAGDIDNLQEHVQAEFSANGQFGLMKQ
jgi:hypothetical protein